MNVELGLRFRAGAWASAILLVLLPPGMTAGEPPESASGKTIRIVQITDIHASHVDHNPPPRFFGDPVRNDLVRSLPALRAAVDYINGHLRPDAVVITGDSVDRGQDLATLREVKVCLTRLQCRWYPVIGDHERKEVYEEVFPGKLNYSCDCGAWHFAALDCNRGRLEPHTLEWLRVDLSAVRKRNCVVMLHRPLVCDPVTQLLGKKLYGTRLLLENADEARTLLHAFDRVKLVLAGHIHVPSETTVEGIRYLTCPALVVAPHCVRLIELSGDQVTSKLVAIPLPQAGPGH